MIVDQLIYLEAPFYKGAKKKTTFLFKANLIIEVTQKVV